MTSRFQRRALAWLVMPLLALSLLAQQDEDGPLDSSLPEGVTVRGIVDRFASQEQIYKQAREHYTYRQSVRVQTISETGFPDGEYDDTFDVTFNDQGERTVKQVSNPRDTLKRIRMTPEDIDDIRNRLPFVLTTGEIPDYNIKYRGQQNTNGTHCYVFDISPKAMEQDRRYFEGRIWVDSRQYQIVKSSGKAVPDIYNQDNENLFPSFTTYRELVDDKYWFPSYTKSDDYLHFSEQIVHVIETVNYTNYKRFGAESRIIFNGKEVGSDSRQAAGQAPSGAQGNPDRQQPPGQQPYGNPQDRNAQPPDRSSQNGTARGAATNRPSPGQQTQPQNSRAPQQPANPPAQPLALVQQALMSLEREISEAITNKQASILNRILTDDFHLVSANGEAQDKYSLLSDVHQGLAGVFGPPESMQVQVNGDRATVIGEREESIPVTKTKMQTARVRFTDTFVRRAGEWFLMQTREAAAR